MYFDTPVAVPDKPGKMTFRQRGESVYVSYEHGRTYDPERKYTLVKRTTVGKLVDPADRSLMYPNANFGVFFPDEVPDERPEASRSGCLRFGTWAVMRKIAGERGLGSILSDVAGEVGGGLALDLAAYSLVTEGNAAQHYPAYAFSHPLFTPGMRMYSDSKVSEFLHDLGREAPPAFLSMWNAAHDHREKIWISYDSTNKDCQAGDLEMVEPGHAKSGGTGPVVNVSIAYDRTNSEPLFYEEYPGSVVDVSQLQCMHEKAAAYGYRHCGFILDRGYFSRSNISYMDEHGYPFVMMVKGMSKLVSSMIDERRGSFECDRDCFVREYSAYGTTLERPLYAGDKKTRCFHLFFSAARAASERAAVERRLNRLADALKRAEGKRHEMSAAESRYFEGVYAKDGTLLFARERCEVSKRELELCGYFAIVTSGEMSARDALLLYKGRDASEKLFTGMKSFLGGDCLRVHSDESVAGKLMVEFVALILRNRMHWLLRERAAASDKKANYMTVPAAVAELEKIEVVRQADGVYRLDHAVTATQREILAAFGMDDADIKRIARELGDELGHTGKGE